MTHKEEFITVRLSKGERARLDKMCKKSGLKISPLIRQLLLGAKITPRPPEIAQELYVEINRIGNNINQIARSVNAGIATPEDARQALFLLGKVYEKLDEAVKR